MMLRLRTRRKVLLILAAAAVAAAAAWLILGDPRIDRTKVYHIGYGIDAPLHFKGPDGAPAGLAVELVREAAKRKGIQLEWVQTTGFNQRTLNMWVLQTLRPERTATVHFTDPFLQSESCFLVLAGSPVKDVHDLTRARVSHFSSAALRDSLARLLPEAERVSVRSSQEAMTKLVDGQVDAAFIDQYAIISTILEGGQAAPLRILPSYSPKRQMALASRVADAAVADEIREGMQSMVSDGTVTEVVKRWAYFPSLTTEVIGDLGNERRRTRWLIAGVTVLSGMLLVTIGLFVTSLRRTRQLRRTESLLRNIADRVPGVVYQFRLRPDGRSSFPYASEAIRQIYRVAPGDVRTDASPVFSILHPDDAEAVKASIKKSAHELTPWTAEYRVRFTDGTVRWLFGNAQPRREAGGGTLWHGFITDITERKAAEAAFQNFERKIQETQKLESLGVLAGGIAHDFNNLLTGILGNATLASLEVSEGAPVQGYLESIRQASLRAADLCKQMLAYSGKGHFVVRKLALNALVSETTQLLQISISKQAALRFDLAPDLPAIEADATQIRQVIMNLVINASEALGPAGGAIRLSTGVVQVDRDYLSGTVLAPEIAVGAYVFLEVSDNGSGMTAETQARIFDPFFTTKFTGRGLGLAAVLGIVRGHQGALKVYSEPGRGTTFKLLFPCATGPVEPAASVLPAPPAWRGSGCVLVVDDEETVRRTAALMLQKLGFETAFAADGQEAVDLFLQEPARFVLVLIDLTMPRLDGREAAAQLRRIRSDVPVLLMSGFNEQEATSEFTGRGLAGFLQKPFQFDAMSAALQRALEPRRG